MSGSGWFLGAYAGYASFADKTADSDAQYMRGLQELPHVAGLELPFYSDLSETASDKYLRTLPKHFDYVLTLLPGTMQSLEAQPEYGLASVSSEGRKAAMSRMTLVHRRIHEINARCGRSAVRAIEIHSAPRGSMSDARSLYDSLEELETWDWQGARLMLEHCDSFRSDGTSIKGFLPLKDEIAVLREVKLRLSLNWGRSALEGRSVATPLEHIAAAQEQNLLGAFFFSGTSFEDPLYGSWSDSHNPLAGTSTASWEPSKGLLTVERVKEIYRALEGADDLLWGIKVQPYPKTLTIEERLAFLAHQLEAFEKARSLD